MIDTIRLEGLMPRVFADMPVESQVWGGSVELRRGGRYLIDAESGRGKSSLCSFIYGNRRDYDGHIYFDNTDTATLSIEDWCRLRRRSLAILPQEMRLFPELTVAENIMLKNSLTDFSTEHEIRDMLNELGIADKYNSPAALLSIGQQQRVGLVRALCQPMDFLLLDEPVSHLDVRNNAIAAAMVDRCAAAQGAAVVVTSVGNHLQLSNFTLLKL